MVTKTVKSLSVFSSIKWSIVSQFGTQGMRFVVSIVLARLLVPNDFGLVAMATVVINFLDIFCQLGIEKIIIQKKYISNELLNTLFIFSLAVGMILSILLFIFAPLMGKIYNDFRVLPILRFLSIIFLFSSFGIIHRSLLKRNMMFDLLAKIELIAASINGIISIVLALWGFRVWSIVIATVIYSLIFTVLLWIITPWRPQWIFNWQEVKRVLGFGLNFTGFQFVNYFTRNSDVFIIGTFLGASPLGFYSVANKLSKYPLELTNRALGKVLFPAFSKIQDDNDQFRRNYLRTCSGIALLAFPIFAGLSVLAKIFVSSLLGEKWVPIISLIIILAPISMIRSISNTVGQIYLAKGRSDWLFWWGIASGILIMLSFLLGLRWGIHGVVSAYAIIMVPISYIGFIIPFKLIELRFTDFLNTLKPYFYSSVVMAASMFSLIRIFEYLNIIPVFILIVNTFSGIAIYTILIVQQKPPALYDLLNLLPFKFTIGKITNVS